MSFGAKEARVRRVMASDRVADRGLKAARAAQQVRGVVEIDARARARDALAKRSILASPEADVSDQPPRRGRRGSVLTRPRPKDGMRRRVRECDLGVPLSRGRRKARPAVHLEAEKLARHP